MKRILVLNYEFPPIGGGASPVSFEIAHRLSKNGFWIDAITMGYSNLPKQEKIRNNFNVYRVRCFRSKKEMCYPQEQLTYLIAALPKAITLHQKNHYDICHTHFIIPTGILALILYKIFKLEYVITSHGSDVPGYNEDRFLLLHKLTPPILRMVCKKAHKIITPSRYLKELILENISPHLKEKTIHIPNGLKRNKFSPQKKNKTIVSTGRLLPRKGFQHLLEAVKNKNLGYEVHIMGDGPMRSELEKIAEDSMTPIIFHGWVNNTSDEYRNILEQASIYVLASSKENASISLLEAMAAGCAIITTNVSGCPETVGPAGIKINPDSVNELREKINFLIKNKEELKNYQQEARSRFENKFTWEKIIIEYEKYLNG